jgi:hypothetical protein
LLPTHCSSAFGKAGIFAYDLRVMKPDKLIKTSSSNSTTLNYLSRSKCVEFDYQNNKTILTTSKTIDTNRIRHLVKYPSDLALF